ncbi:anti-sigma factor [Chryseobacterium sp. Mn2064]|uniref:anti-sigma factor n=1 Tax=Chryseobacterium sp. Mn2064 TaxID=3395263 RepID=UPI003BC15D36
MNTKEYISSGIIESYILGHASPEEAGILECVMKNNTEVKEAVEEAQKTLENLATAQAVTPPDDLRSKIWNKIQEQQTAEELQPVIALDIPSAKPQEETKIEGKSNIWKNLAIAASVILIASIAGNMFWMKEEAERKIEIAEMHTEKQAQDIEMQKMNQKIGMFSNPDMQMVMLKGVEKHTDSKAMVFWDKKTKDVYLSAESLPKAPTGMQYQLWAIADGKPVSAGLYSENKDSLIVLAQVPQAQAFAITLEKEGGSKEPTMENMYVMGGV